MTTIRGRVVGGGDTAAHGREVTMGGPFTAHFVHSIPLPSTPLAARRAPGCARVDGG